ncbi:MAG: cyclodeaminase/cyclohydrolase family protein, partial [Synergistaceae bacterium]|nr:cyclodeaminase/cyclohydrolase family protein [Synergistaceae bacterium]
MDFYEAMDNIMDSHDVTVGGGSASAAAAAMAAGLIGMVARLSVSKNGKTYGLPDDEYIACADRLDRLGAELKRGASDDADAYIGLRNAYAMPKETDGQKSARRAAIEDAAVAAASVPLKNAKLAASVSEIAA